MTQKEQQALLKAFRNGDFNVMIATCIAEEGLDIPQARCSTLGQWLCPDAVILLPLLSLEPHMAGIHHLVPLALICIPQNSLSPGSISNTMGSNVLRSETWLLL